MAAPQRGPTRPFPRGDVRKHAREYLRAPPMNLGVAHLGQCTATCILRAAAHRAKRVIPIESRYCLVFCVFFLGALSLPSQSSSGELATRRLP
jgi:hypothetical protein